MGYRRLTSRDRATDVHKATKARDAGVRFGIVPAHGPEHLDATFEQLSLCREYGFDSVWIEEHHEVGPYWPTPLLAIAAIAPHLGGLTVGTNILILPLHDPVHVAEQAAILDRMTQGRMILGVGLGDSSAEFSAFRVPSNRRGARFEEQIAIIRGLWKSEVVSHQGVFYKLHEVQLATAPVQPSGPPMWIGGWGPKQISRAARLGDAWFPGPVGTMTEIIGLLDQYEHLVRDQGQDPALRERPITRDVVIAPTEVDAWKLASGSVLKSYRETYVASKHPLIGQGSGAVFDDLKDLARDRLIIGDPTGVAAQLARCIKQARSSHVILRLKLPGLDPADITRMLRLLGRHVLPVLRTASASDKALSKLAAGAEA